MDSSVRHPFAAVNFRECNLTLSRNYSFNVRSTLIVKHSFLHGFIWKDYAVLSSRHRLAIVVE